MRGSTLGFIGTVAACAVCLGMLLITATVLGIDAMRTDQGPRHLDLSFYLLVGGTLAGILLAAYSAWHMLAPVGSTYRRGALSIVAAFTTVLFMLICMPVHQLLGRTGLLGLLAVCGAAALILARRVRRLETDG
ncbi:MAG TPA: hypothetical protein VGN76_08595 [Gemmatimonadales bacterium]|nr:hypothetical protein [Gemmatimonadales bacterium]